MIEALINIFAQTTPMTKAPKIEPKKNPPIHFFVFNLILFFPLPPPLVIAEEAEDTSFIIASVRWKPNRVCFAKNYADRLRCLRVLIARELPPQFLIDIAYFDLIRVISFAFLDCHSIELGCLECSDIQSKRALTVRPTPILEPQSILMS